MRIVSVLVATAAGAAVGWVCGLVPVWPVVRLVAAAVLGLVAGAIASVAFALFLVSRSGSGGLGAVSFGLSEAAIVGVPALVLVAVASHFVLRAMGWAPAHVATYGSIVFGGGAALVAALWLTRAIVISGG